MVIEQYAVYSGHLEGQEYTSYTEFFGTLKEAFNDSKRIFKSGKFDFIAVYVESFKTKADFNNGEPTSDLCLQSIGELI